VRLIQDQRKEIACQYTDRIELSLVTSSTELTAAINNFRDYIAQETLANKIVDQLSPGVRPIAAKVLGHELMIYLRVVK
jgi:isoleucyl-tRNA synthetase